MNAAVSRPARRLLERLKPCQGRSVGVQSNRPILLRYRRLHTTLPEETKLRKLPTDIKRYTKSDFAEYDMSNLPASIQLFHQRCPVKVPRQPVPRGSRKPVVNRLPPLPLIHDWALALAAVDYRTAESRERVVKLALMGDRLLEFWGVFAMDQSGVASSSGTLSVKKSALVTNSALSHLANLYGLVDVAMGVPDCGTTTNIWNQGTMFEAWIAASWLDARQRGAQAREEWEVAIEWMFRDEVWYKPAAVSESAKKSSSAYPLSSLRKTIQDIHVKPGYHFPTLCLRGLNPQTGSVIFDKPAPSQIGLGTTPTVLEGHPPVSLTGPLGVGDPFRCLYERRKVIRFVGHDVPMHVDQSSALSVLPAVSLAENQTDDSASSTGKPPTGYAPRPFFRLFQRAAATMSSVQEHASQEEAAQTVESEDVLTGVVKDESSAITAGPAVKRPESIIWQPTRRGLENQRRLAMAASRQED